MKTALLVLALPSVALADEDPHVAIEPMTTTTAAACDAIVADVGVAEPEAATCKRVAAKKVKGVGAAALYALTNLGGDQSDWTKYTLVIDDGSGTLALSPMIDVASEVSETLGKVSPKLRAIHLDGGAAVAAVLTVQMTHRPKTPWTRRVVLACGKNPAADWRCAIGDYGTSAQRCTMSLADDGSITYACGATTSLSLM